MVQPYYQPFYQKARELQFKFHDVADQNQSHPSVNLLRHEFRQLEADIESGKHPRTVENRIHTIQRQIDQAQRMNQRLMSYEHTDHFHDNLERMRMDLRRLPHY